MKIKNTILVGIAVVTFSSCEDVIDLDLDNGKNQLVVDAFINSDDTVQTIRLTSSASYFSNVATPANNSSIVRVLGPNNLIYDFNTDGEGNYKYDPIINGAIDSIGYPFILEVEHNGNLFRATSILNPVPVIDSMPFDFEPEGFGTEEGYYSQFYARDFAVRKDYYWIKPFKNDSAVYDDPTFIILSEDATFGGDAGDGLVFIVPLRASITNSEKPFKEGDTSSVELHSLNNDAYEFLDQVVNTSGNDGLFAVPPSNIRSNILDEAGNSQDLLLGLFSISAISKFEVVIPIK